MPQYTENYKIIKPNIEEHYDIVNIDHENADIIDNEIKNVNDRVDIVESELYKPLYQKTTTYDSVVPNPPNTTNGQVSGVVRGLTATNLIENGDFRDGKKGWTHTGGNVGGEAWDDNELVWEPIANQYVYKSQNVSCKAGDILYVSAKIKIFDGDRRGILGVSDRDTFDNHVRVFAEDTTYTLSSVRAQINHDNARVNIGIASSELGDGKVGFKEVMAINLTQTFGEGNEPTKEECDQIFANYFDGTKSTIGSARVKSVGKNLAKDTGKRFRGYTTDKGAEILVDGESWFTKENFKVQPNRNYRFIASEGSGGYIYYKDINRNWISREPKSNKVVFTTPSDCYHVDFQGSLDTAYDIKDVKLMLIQEGESMDYEPYTESIQYIIAKDKDGKIVNLRSLPNGTKDEVRVSENKLIKRIGAKTNVASGTVINYTDMADGGQFVAYYEDGTQQVGIKGDTLTSTATKLTYQLAEPEIIPLDTKPLEVFPGGTIYIEPYIKDKFVVDSTKTIDLQYPIVRIDKLLKLDVDGITWKEVEGALSDDGKTIIVTEEGTYEVYGEIRPEYSTLGEKTIRVPTNLRAQITSNSEAIKKIGDKIYADADLFIAMLLQQEMRIILLEGR